MTAEERYQILSNDYFDIIVEYNQNLAAFNRFPNATYHIMNEEYAVVYIPRSQLTENLIRQIGYTPIPSLYGLTVQNSFEASGIQRLRRLPNFDLRGQGVIVGIIDTGVDYVNPVFRNQDGTTKIAAIWDQTIESENYPLPFFYGTQYLREDINRALSSENPLEVVPSTDTNGHGTMLAGITAGSDLPEQDFSGVVPESELIVVKLKQAKQIIRDYFIVPSDVDCYQENDIMWGVQYVVDMARSLQRPVAICIGLGSSQGSHDGRGALSNILSIAADFPGIAVSISAGNEGNAARHFYSEINQSLGYRVVELNIGENEPGFAMELWGAAPNTYSIDILSPTGEYIPRITESLRVNRDISFVFERTTITVEYYMVESSTGDQLIFLRFRNPTEGIWTFRVYTRGDLTGSFNIWLPMNGFMSNNTYFVQPDPYTTITSPGNSPVPITVTAYNTDNNTLYRRASKGYSRINTIKPEIAAPGVNIKAPALNQTYTSMTGTSAAAAHTAGITAMILEWAIVRGNYPGVDTVEIKKFIIRGAIRNPNIVYPNRDWGYGILDIYNVFDTLRASVYSQ
jgi:subtilisin family serine protease